MTQQPDIRSIDKLLNPRLLMRGLGWLGGLSLLGSGVVFAQTVPTDAVTVPSAQDLLTPSESAPVAPQPPAVSEPPAVEFNNSSPAVSSPAPQSAPSANTSGSSSDNASDAQIALPETVVDEIQTLSPGSDRPIDTTDYNLGATPAYGQRPDVVLSERSTGCQATVQHGQNVPASLCASSTFAGGQRTASVGSVQIGPVRLGSNGIGIGRNYYNLTQRPMGLVGNGNRRLVFPLSLPVSITSAFGWRIHPITGAMRFHYGTDLGAPMGTPVLAAYSGRVAIADFMNGYGLTVVMRHASPDAQTLYGHMSEIFVHPGEVIEQGQVIGRVGSTGNSTGPHLHFEYREYTRDGWVALNPGGLLENALAQFGAYFQTAEAEPAEEQLVVFHLDGVDGLLKALKENPEILADIKAQSFGEFPVAFDPSVTDLILNSLDNFDPNELDQLKGWSKAIAAAKADEVAQGEK